MKIEVTARDIEYGAGGDPGECALARALRGKFGVGADEVSVGLCSVTLPDREGRVKLPVAAVVFREAFDAWRLGGGPRPKPITFELPDA